MGTPSHMSDPPSSTPSQIECIVDPDFLWKDKEGRDCAWASENIENRCVKPAIAEACKVTCDTDGCGVEASDAPSSTPSQIECIDDPDFRWKDRDDWDCDWVGENIENRCAKQAIAAA